MAAATTAILELEVPSVTETEELSDEQAIARTRGGDPNAFRVLVERYQGRIQRLALRVLRDEEAARDATQDAFVKAYQALGRFQGRSRFYTWLYRLAMNQCLDHKRRDKSGRQVEWDEGAAFEPDVGAAAAPVAAGDAPGAALERKELRAQLARAIEQLPDTTRETLVLREVEGLSYKEIADALGIPKGTVMSRLHSARQRLRALLEEAGVDPADIGDEG